MFWAVATSHPRRERCALEHLERQGFVAYAPQERVTLIRRGRKVEDERLLFPRYLFVWIEERWHRMLSTICVSKVIMNGEKPSPLPSGWVETMRQSEVDGAIVLPKQRLRIGERVPITSGIFAGCSGLYQGQTSRQREVVLLDALGRVELALGSLD